MRTLFCIFSCLWGLFTSLHAQTFTGKVTDEANTPIEFANVVLLSLPDSTFLQGTISNQSGEFSIAGTGQPCLLRISSVGYLTVHKACTQASLGVIALQSDTQLLDEVVVKGDLPKTRIKGDAMVTGVAGTVLEKAGTAGDLLDKIPNVSSEDGMVKVFGRGEAEIYINGRKMRDASELDQLSSENIKSVEVVSNPGARYDASVKSVIRILTRRTAGEGFGASNRTVARHRRTYGWTAFDQLDMHYMRGGLEVSGMLYGGVFRGGNNQRITMETRLDKLWQQDMDATYARTRHNSLSGNLSLNYRFHEKHSVGVRYGMGSAMNTDGDWRYLSQVYCDGKPYESSDSRMLINDPSHRNDLNVYYNGQAGEWEIDFNADGLWNKVKESQHTTETVNKTEERQIHTFNENQGDLYAAKLVVSRPLWQGTLSLGGEYSHTNRTNLYLNREGILSDDDSEIKEGAASGFADYSRSFGKVHVQLGVRYEHVKFDYYETGKRVDVQSRQFNNVFPSLNVTFPIGKAQVQLGYTEDIARPSYDNLRNNTYYANRYTYQTGNPFLVPTLTRNLSLAASYRWLSLSAGYSRVDDDMMQMAENYSEEDPTISLLKVVNLPAYDQMTASLTLAPVIGCWRPQFTAQVYKQWFSMDDGAGGKISLNKPVGTLVWRNNFSLPAGFMVDVDGTYTTRGNMQHIYLRESAGNVSLSLQKSFCKDRLTLQVQASNLLETNDDDIVMYSGIRTMTNYVTSFRQWTCTLRYKFNQTKSKYKGTGAGKSQKSRM